MDVMRGCGVALAMALMLGLLGCGQREPQPPGSGPSLEDVKKETGEALSTTKDYLAKQKDELLAQMQKGLGEMEAKLSALKAKAQAQGAQATADFEKIKQDFDAKMATAKVDLAKAREASGEAWGDMKAGLQSAYAELDEAYKQAATRFQSEPPEVERERPAE